MRSTWRGGVSVFVKLDSSICMTSCNRLASTRLGEENTFIGGEIRWGQCRRESGMFGWCGCSNMVTYCGQDAESVNKVQD